MEGIITNTVYNESCLTTMSRMENQSIDLVVTSPPYNMQLRVHKGEYKKRGSHKSFSKKYQEFTDDMPVDEFYNFHKKVIEELLRVSKVTIYNFSIVTGSKTAFFKLVGHFSEHIKYVIIWDKGHGEPAMQHNIINRCTELILVIQSKKEAGRYIENSYFERGTLNDIWRVKKGKSSKLNRALMPDNVAGKAILSFSKENDLIYDPFGGSGTTAIASLKYNRRFIISELVKEQAKEAEKNILKYSSLPRLF